MPTIKQAVKFANDNGLEVSRDIRQLTEKYFYVYGKGVMDATIVQEKPKSKAWWYKENLFYTRAAAIINAVTKITDAQYK